MLQWKAVEMTMIISMPQQQSSDAVMVCSGINYRGVIHRNTTSQKDCIRCVWLQGFFRSKNDTLFHTTLQFWFVIFCDTSFCSEAGTNFAVFSDILKYIFHSTRFLWFWSVVKWKISCCGIRKNARNKVAISAVTFSDKLLLLLLLSRQFRSGLDYFSSH